MSRGAITQRTTHTEQLEFLNRLCIDLKKALLGGASLGYEEDTGSYLQLADGTRIDSIRLDEFTRTIDKLAQCKERIVFHREGYSAAMQQLY